MTRRRCSTLGCDAPAEWELALVYRHDRAVTEGSRVIDARRPLDEPDYRCNACAQLIRRGHVPQGGLL